MPYACGKMCRKVQCFCCVSLLRTLQVASGGIKLQKGGTGRDRQIQGLPPVVADRLGRLLEGHSVQYDTFHKHDNPLSIIKRRVSVLNNNHWKWVCPTLAALPLLKVCLHVIAGGIWDV